MFLRSLSLLFNYYGSSIDLFFELINLETEALYYLQTLRVIIRNNQYVEARVFTKDDFGE